MSETSTLFSCTGRITRAELAKLPTPPATATHIPIPHAAVVEILVETLSHRQISVVGEESAVSNDDMEMFGVLDLETSFEGCRFAIGIRNANNKRFRLACTVGLRVFRKDGAVISPKRKIVTHEHSQPDRACQPESLVVRVSDSDREAASLEAGFQIEDTKHLHIILRYGELLTDDGNMTVTQRLDQGFHDRSVRNRNMCSRCRRRWQIRQFRSRYSSSA